MPSRIVVMGMVDQDHVRHHTDGRIDGVLNIRTPADLVLLLHQI